MVRILADLNAIGLSLREDRALNWQYRVDRFAAPVDDRRVLGVARNAESLSVATIDRRERWNRRPGTCPAGMRKQHRVTRGDHAIRRMRSCTCSSHAWGGSQRQPLTVDPGIPVSRAIAQSFIPDAMSRCTSSTCSTDLVTNRSPFAETKLGAESDILRLVRSPPLRAWRNGRRAVFRCPCSKERGGSNPPARTQNVGPSSHTRLNRHATWRANGGAAAMGNRANIVVVESGGRQLPHSHGDSCRTFDVLMAGPDYDRRLLSRCVS